MPQPNPMSTTDAAELFDIHFQQHQEEREAESATPIESWRAGGRRSKEYPNKEDRSWWLAHGPKMVADYISWRERMLDAGWHIWQAPGGLPAIELELMATFGDIPVKMALDRVFVSPDGELVVVDLKAGSRTPDSDLQLNFYACGMEQVMGIRPQYGSYYMARKGEWTGPVPLTMSIGQLTAELQLFNKALDNEIFLPNRGSHCISCGVARACAAVNGAEAHLYDLLHPDYGKATA